jgi:hypothetical protein
MKKLLLPAVAIAALVIGTGCDRKEKLETETTDITTSTTLDSPTESEAFMAEEVDGDTTGIQAEEAVIEKTDSHKGAKLGGAAAAGAVGAEALDDDAVYDDSFYPDSDRQAMEEVTIYEEFDSDDYSRYPEEKLNRLEDKNAIFYGNPGASGSSGSPGSADLVD